MPHGKILLNNGPAISVCDNEAWSISVMCSDRHHGCNEDQIAVIRQAEKSAEELWTHWTHEKEGKSVGEARSAGWWTCSGTSQGHIYSGYRPRVPTGHMCWFCPSPSRCNDNPQPSVKICLCSHGISLVPFPLPLKMSLTCPQCNWSCKNLSGLK